MRNHLLLSVIQKRILLTALVLSIALTGMSQRWTNVITAGLGGGAETGRGVCTDASGNVYYIGIFSGANTDFDPGPGLAPLSPLGIQDVFVAKYNSDGILQWAVRGGGISQDQGAGIAIDGTGVYIIGNFAGSATFGPYNLTANGGSGTDMFVAKLDFNGNYQWAKNFGAASLGGDNGQAVCTDGAGSIYISGSFNNAATFGTFNLSATGGSGSDMVVAKLLASTGDVLWATSGGSSASTDNGTGSTICYHPGLGEVIVGGSYFGTSATYGGFTLSNSGGNDLVLLELNANTGAITQAFGFGGSGGADDDIAGVCYDAKTGDIFLTGFYNGNITFTGTPQLTNAGLGDLFVARYDPDANTFLWSVSGGSTGEERSYGITSNSTGQVYIAGYYSGSMSWGSANLTAATAAPEVLVAGLSVDDGSKIWALNASGNDATLADQARAISVGGNMKKIAVTGQFAGTGTTFGSFTFNSAGSVDIFMAQLAAGITGTVTPTDPTCDNGCNGSAVATINGGVLPLHYSWSPSGGTTATASNLCPGNYTLTVTDDIGQSAPFAITINAPVVSAANEEAINASFNISPSNTYIANAACKLIARVVPIGGTPINGPVSAFVKFEPAVPVYPLVTGEPFVQRHYQITPASGAATAMGRVTLYFSQAEFNNFNAHPGATLKLPTSAGDAAGIANIRIGKYPGNSTDNSGLPGSYTAGAQVINPNDADIIFNATENRWEITFDVTGFSGFILQTSAVALPVTWVKVTAFLDNQHKAQLRWEVQESQVDRYEVERSVDGTGYMSIATIASKGDGEHAYTYNESTSVTGKVYYRIKQIDKDGRSSYSQIMILSNQQGGTVTVYPNPTSGTVILNITDSNLMNTVARLYNSDGRELQQINIRQTVTNIVLNNHSKGTYFLKLSNGQILRLIRK